MPRSSNQKLKPLYLAKILLERTDENIALTAQCLVDALAVHDIPANRKSIYDDIDALREYGLDIEHRHGKAGGYFIASRKSPDSRSIPMLWTLNISAKSLA